MIRVKKKETSVSGWLLLQLYAAILSCRAAVCQDSAPLSKGLLKSVLRLNRPELQFVVPRAGALHEELDRLPETRYNILIGKFSRVFRLLIRLFTAAHRADGGVVFYMKEEKR